MSQRAIAFLFACLAFFAVNATAQISVGPSGVGPLTFDTAPPAADFSSLVLTGNGDTYSDLANLDAGVATVDASLIVRPLDVIAEATPSPFAGIFRYNSQLQAITTRPTTGGSNAAVVLLGKFVNNSGQDRTTAILTYSHLTRNNLTGGHLYGMSVYWSLTGAPGSWTSIPELNSELNGDLLASLPLGSWAQGSTLYVLWVDDNSNAIQDPSYTIDNLSLVFTVNPPVITQQPRGTNVVVNQRVQLSVVASGVGLTYQWFKDSLPVDVGVYATANQATLIITNAQFADAGAYHVVVSNPGGPAISDTVTVNVGDDTIKPVMLFFSQVAGGTRSFRLAVSERLCDTVDCANDATFVFNWVFGEVGGSEILMESVTPENGTNYICVIPDPFAIDPAKKYYLQPVPGLITDLFNNALEGSITNSPVVVFNTDIADAEIHSNAGADTPLGAATSVSVDNDDAGIAQALLRFNNLIGPGLTQIPQGAVIVNATLTLNQTDQGSAANLHRMLIDWDQATVTWNSLVDGVTANNIEAVSTSDGISVNEPFPNGPMNIEVTAGVQAWANGAANYGWAFLSTGNGGWDWSTSESGTPPSLSVTYTVPPCATAPVFTVHPASPTVTEGASFTLTATLTGACNSSYQWSRNNVDILGATGSSYTAVAVPGAGGNSGDYRLRVTNPNGTATSNPGTVTVNPDMVAPAVLRVFNSNSTTLTVSFTKVMGPSAGVAANYTLNGVAASAAVLAADGRSVTLTTAARTFPTAYSLRIADVRDNRIAQNVLSPNPTVVPISTVEVVLPYGGAWQYNSNNLDTAAGWQSVPTASLDASWQTGNELFGTETSGGVVAIMPVPIATPMPPNSVAADWVTYYFRKDITLPALPAGASYVVNHLTDDGVVFYLDGVEIGRLNMPAAPEPITYTNRATTAGEAAFRSLAFSASAGAHILAAEVHQGGTASSDMLFGAQILLVPTAAPTLTITHVGANAEFRWIADNKWELQSATNVLGPYNTVAVPATSPLGFYSAPATGNVFYRLHYIWP